MNSITNKRGDKQLLYINFNQDYSCISFGTDQGYIIYNVNPLKEIYNKSK